MIENWAYAALAEHIYRRNEGSDQALRETDLRNQGGLINDNRVLLDLEAQDANHVPALNSLGFFISEGRYIYNPATN